MWRRYQLLSDRLFRKQYTESIKDLPLGDLSFFVRSVFSASAAELLDRELFRHRSTIFIGDVVVAFAFLTGQLDDISHDQLPPLRRTKSSHLPA